jgi:hypothetical protein
MARQRKVGRNTNQAKAINKSIGRIKTQFVSSSPGMPPTHATSWYHARRVGDQSRPQSRQQTLQHFRVEILKSPVVIPMWLE